MIKFHFNSAYDYNSLNLSRGLSIQSDQFNRIYARIHDQVTSIKLYIYEINDPRVQNRIRRCNESGIATKCSYWIRYVIFTAHFELENQEKKICIL